MFISEYWLLRYTNIWGTVGTPKIGSSIHSHAHDALDVRCQRHPKNSDGQLNGGACANLPKTGVKKFSCLSRNFPLIPVSNSKWRLIENEKGPTAPFNLHLSAGRSLYD
jgi:hypothetical protein